MRTRTLFEILNKSAGWRYTKQNRFMEKTLDAVNIADVKQKVSDVTVFGNGDLFQLIAKASSKEQGWMKSTKAMQTPHGCVVQVTTQQKNVDLTYSVAEAL
jgi:tRNA-dihydrouridine synthase